MHLAFIAKTQGFGLRGNTQAHAARARSIHSHGDGTFALLVDCFIEHGCDGSGVWLLREVEFARGKPLHFHVSEQRAEN